jgi:hypothetical protein
MRTECTRTVIQASVRLALRRLAIRNTRKIAAVYHHGKLIPNPAPLD